MSPRIGTLMLVDDSEIEQTIYARIIKRSGLVGALKQFVDAAKALEHVLDDEAPLPDLILLDINMPGLNGFDFLDAVQSKLGPQPSPAVAVLTSSLNPAHRQRAQQFPQVREFLNKPLTSQHLLDLGDRFGKPAG